jgi:ATP-binding cassette subfamily B protein
MAADKIVALEDGEIREEGTHLELLARRGLYFRLCEEQYKVLFALDDEGKQMRLAR